MKNSIFTVLVIVSLLAVGCSAHGSDDQLQSEHSPVITPEATFSPIDDNSQEDAIEDADITDIVGTWEFDDENYTGVLSYTWLLIRPDLSYVWRLNCCAAATGTLTVTDHELSRWTSEDTLLITDSSYYDPPADSEVYNEYEHPVDVDVLTFLYEESNDRLIIQINGVDFNYLYQRVNTNNSEHTNQQIPSVDYRDYGIVHGLSYEIDGMHMSEYPLERLVAYYLGSDGAYSYSPSFELLARFIENPNEMLEFIALVGEITVRGESVKSLLCVAIVLTYLYNRDIVFPSLNNSDTNIPSAEYFEIILDTLEEKHKLESNSVTEVIVMLRSAYEERLEEYRQWVE